MLVLDEWEMAKARKKALSNRNLKRIQDGPVTKDSVCGILVVAFRRLWVFGFVLSVICLWTGDVIWHDLVHG